MQQNCDEVNNALLQPRSPSLAQFMADRAHRRHQASYNGNTSGRKRDSLRHPEFSDDDNDTMSPPHDTTESDIMPKFEEMAENYDSSQSTRKSNRRSESSKHGERRKVKRRRKSEAPSRAYSSDLSVDTTPDRTPSSSGKQKLFRVKLKKSKRDKLVQKNEPHVAEDSEESDAKPAGSASEDVIHACEDCGK